MRRFPFFACVGAAGLASVACGHQSGTLPPPTLKGYPSSGASTTSAPAPAAQPPAAPPREQVVTAQLAPPPPLHAAAAGERAPPRDQQVEPLPPPTQAVYVKRQYEPPMPLASEGRRFFVRGVDRSDVLNIRAEPGAKSPVIGEIPPETTGIVSTGARRQVGPGIWREVTYRGVRGWVNERFLVEERDPSSPGNSPDP
jgi:Bacterial SH3 domain